MGRLAPLIIAIVLLLSVCSLAAMRVGYGMEYSLKASADRNNWNMLQWLSHNDEKHEQTMSERKALAPTKLLAKETLILTLTSCLVIMSLFGALLGGWLGVGTVSAKVTRLKIAATEVYPDQFGNWPVRIVKVNGRLIGWHTGTGKRIDLGKIGSADKDLLAANTSLQLAMIAAQSEQPGKFRQAVDALKQLAENRKLLS